MRPRHAAAGWQFRVAFGRARARHGAVPADRDNILITVVAAAFVALVAVSGILAS